MPVALAISAWLALLAAILCIPSLIHSPTLGDDPTRNTVRLTLLYYAVAASLILLLRPDEWAGLSGRARLARRCWTLAWAAYVTHVGIALHH